MHPAAKPARASTAASRMHSVAVVITRSDPFRGAAGEADRKSSPARLPVDALPRMVQEIVLPQVIVDAGPAAVGEVPGVLGLRDVSPLHVAAYIRTHPGSALTVKQHPACSATGWSSARSFW